MVEISIQAFDHFIHCPVVIPSHFLVGHPAMTRPALADTKGIALVHHASALKLCDPCIAVTSSAPKSMVVHRTSASHSEKKVMRPQENHHRRIEPVQSETIPATSYLGGVANVMPCRRKTSIIFERSGGPPLAAPITSAASRKYLGPIIAGVMMTSCFTFSQPRLSKR
jgi:hypothetical protein